MNVNCYIIISGAGKYQVFHCALMVAILGASMLEIIGYSFILPAAACDLDISDSLRGVITSIPNIGKNVDKKIHNSVFIVCTLTVHSLKLF